MPFDFPNHPTVGQTALGPNGVTYTWDGVKWYIGGITGGIVAAGSMTPRQPEMRFADRYSVLDWLTPGQPDGTTDNSAQLQAAITAAAGKASLTFPASTHSYIVGTAPGLQLPSNTHLSIEAGATLLIAAGTTGVNCFGIVPGAANVLIDIYGTLDGNGGATTPPASPSGGIVTLSGGSCSNVYVRGDRQGLIRNFVDWPINITNCTNGEVAGITIDGGGYSNSAEFAGLTPANAASVTAGTYNTTTGAAVFTTSAAHGMNPGDAFVLLNTAGTGNYQALAGSYTASAGTAGTTINATTYPGFGAATLTGATLRGPTKSCINVGFSNCIIRNIADLGCVLYGGVLRGFIRDCDIYNCTGGGAMVFSDNAQCGANVGCEIVDNVLHDNGGYGAYVGHNLNVGNIRQRHITVGHNNIFGNNGCGIYVIDADGVLIDNNAVHDNIYQPNMVASLGITGEISTHTNSGRVTISNNVIHNPNIGCTDGNGYGIAFNTSNYLVIEGNRIGDYQPTMSMQAALGGNWGQFGLSNGNYYGPRIATTGAFPPDQSVYQYASQQGPSYDSVSQTWCGTAAVPGGPYLPTSGGTVTGPTTYTNGLQLGTVAAAQAQYSTLQSAAGYPRQMRAYTGAIQRWSWGVDGSAEAGGNAGSQWVLNAYNDSPGSFIGSVARAVRTSGPPGTVGAPQFDIFSPYTISNARAVGGPGGVVGNNNALQTADVQPTTTLGNNPLSVTSGSPVVQVTWTGCGLSTGVLNGFGQVWVNIQGATAVGGITPSGWLRATRVGNNIFSVTWTSNATSTALGGGSAVTVTPSFSTVGHKDYHVLTTGANGFPEQYQRIFVANPSFYTNVGTPWYEQEFRQVFSPNDPSAPGTNSWGVAATELDLMNRGQDPGYSPNLFEAVNPTIGFWCGAYPQDTTGIAGGGTATNWNTVYSIFGGTGLLANYVGYSIMPNALVGAANDPTGHGGVGIVLFGSTTTISAGGIATTSGTSTVTYTMARGTAQVNGNSVYIPIVTTLNGVTVGGGSYVMSGVTANTFNVTGTGTASATGTGGAQQWVAFATFVPYAPIELRGSFKHGISTTNFRSEDGSIINTQPGNGIVWNDGTGSASVNASIVSAGNLNVLLNAVGTGQIIANSPIVLPANPTSALQAATKGYVDSQHGATPLYSTFTSVGNGADLSEDTLQTYVVPAGQLANVGDRLVIEVGGTLGGTTDSKTVRVRLNGGTPIANATTAAAAQVAWAARIVLAKTGSSAQSTISLVNLSSIGSGTSTTTSVTDTATITITVTGQNATNSVAGSITCRYFTVDYVH